MTAEEYARMVAESMTERQLQNRVIAALRLRGYRSPKEHLAARQEPSEGVGIVWQTADSKHNANTAGLPDLIIKPRWRFGTIGIELKRPNGKGRLSPAQKLATLCGAYQVAKSVDEVLAIVERAEGKAK